jgi:hypothetical protein
MRDPMHDKDADGGAGHDGGHEGRPEEDPPIASILEACARSLAVRLIEVLEGVRPVEHVIADVSPAVALRVRSWSRAPGALVGTTRRATGPIRVRSVRSDRPSPTAFEACVILEHRGRVRAVAVRFELHEGRWRPVELAPPECGLPALRTVSGTLRRTATRAATVRAPRHGPTRDTQGARDAPSDGAGDGADGADDAGADDHGPEGGGPTGGARPSGPHRPGGRPSSDRIASEDQAPSTDRPTATCVAVRPRGSA